MTGRHGPEARAGHIHTTARAQKVNPQAPQRWHRQRIKTLHKRRPQATEQGSEQLVLGQQLAAQQWQSVSTQPSINTGRKYATSKSSRHQKAASEGVRQRRLDRNKPQAQQSICKLTAIHTKEHRMCNQQVRRAPKAATKEGRRRRLDRKAAQDPHKVSQQAHIQSTNWQQMRNQQVRRAPKAATKEGRRRRLDRKKPQGHKQWQAAGPPSSASNGAKLATSKSNGCQKAATNVGRRHRLEKKSP